MLQENPECMILCMSEHWKSTEQLDNLGINNFNLMSAFCREEGRHGGSAIYIHKSISAKQRHGLSKFSLCEIFECAAAECKIGEISLVIIAIYRPPQGNVRLFMDTLEELLANICQENKAIVVAGDFNIELLKDNKVGCELITVFNSFNLVQTVTENTRVTAISGSCIDNVFTNLRTVECKVIEYFISDHMAQKVAFETKSTAVSDNINKRIFSPENKSSFLRTLKDQNWNNVYNIDCNNVNGQWDNFISTFIRIFNQNFPPTKIKTKKTKSFKTHPDVINYKQKLDLLLTLSRHNDRYKEAYKSVKQNYDNVLKRIRIRDYDNRISKSDNKMKCMWTIIKEITGKNRDCSEIQLEGNAEIIANNFNSFLVNEIPNMVQNVQRDSYGCIIPNDKSMFLEPVSPDEVCELADQIKNKHSSGIDEIPTSLIKMSVSELRDVLCFIINNSFKFGIFPNQLKTALIKPLYKNGDPQIMKSYRPISLLPGFSKLFELAMSKRIVNFMNYCHLISRNQHGFIKGKSTQTALYQFIQSVIRHFENKEVALGIFLDISKAYDCLDRDILLNKLERYGIRGQPLKWVKSYLQDRKQLVGINKNGHLSKSQTLLNNYGIAQGSILGPTLFVVFMNDLYSVADDSWQSIINYADDTNLLVGDKTRSQLISKSQSLTSKAAKWFNENGLVLNSEKTNIVLFKTKRSNFDNLEQLLLMEKNIIISENTKFLGVYVNENLDWGFHVDGLLKRLGSISYGMRITGRYLSEHSLKVLYCANFESILRYGIIFWGRDGKIQNAFVAQKRVIRIIKKMDYRQSCRNTFKSMGIMTVYALYIYECLMFFFNNRASLFTDSRTNKYNTRLDNQIYPTHHLNITEKSPNYMCIKLYNKLPIEIKQITSQKKFKVALKRLLIELEPYHLDDYLNT